MTGKKKIALYWCSGCGGCEESVLDLAGDLLEVVASVDVVFWPVAMDFKKSDLLAMDDGDITATLINGAVRMDEQEEMVGLLRRKSRLLIAHGSCAHLGGVAGLANFYQPEEVLGRSYREVPSLLNHGGVTPLDETEDTVGWPFLSGFQKTVRALDQVVEIDYYLPGCPPTPDLTRTALAGILSKKLPPRGSVIADRKALCDSCPRKESRPEKLRVKTFKRLHETKWDPAKCFLEQELICLGPATRGGCGARCINGNMPCRGCFGPTETVRDQGAKSVSFLASLLDPTDEGELNKAAESIPDPAGLFYRYSLPSSILKGRIRGMTDE